MLYIHATHAITPTHPSIVAPHYLHTFCRFALPVTHYLAPTHPTGAVGSVNYILHKASYIQRTYSVHTAYIHDHDHDVGVALLAWTIRTCTYIYIYTYIHQYNHIILYIYTEI